MSWVKWGSGRETDHWKMSKPRRRSQRRAISARFFCRQPETPVGRLEVAGYLTDSLRLCTWPLRLLHTTYGLVYVTEGGGYFRDALGNELEILCGDLILLFPDVPHSYGPKPGGKWSEIFVHFDGPAFDPWRQNGLLDPAQPVRRLLPVEQWRAEMETVLDLPVVNTSDHVTLVGRFLGLLARMLTTGAVVDAASSHPRWLQDALTLLETDFNRDLSLTTIAAHVGLSYHTFRRRFAEATGMAPAQYRLVRRMDAACALLRDTRLSVREIAESLNFHSEFHFSDRFQKHTGLRPSKYRREGRMGTLPHPEEAP